MQMMRIEVKDVGTRLGALSIVEGTEMAITTGAIDGQGVLAKVGIEAKSPGTGNQ